MQKEALPLYMMSKDFAQAKLAEIGQWGGVGGGPRDIEIAPRCLKSLTIGSGKVIYSLEFSYDDHHEKNHTTGPWGGHGPDRHGSKIRDKIVLQPTEFLTVVSGTIGPYDSAPAGVIKSLTFITTAGRYGPFGEEKGTPFQIPVQSNGSIVGFFARAGWYLDAFGIYVKPMQETEEAGLAKIGPWGGNGGQVRDTKMPPQHLESVTICSGTVITSLTFMYHGLDGKQHTAGPWGTSTVHPDRTDTILLGSSEFLTGVRGTTGPFDPTSSDVIVTSLTLITNTHSYGPFGEGTGAPFKIPLWGKGSIVGFFGRSESYINAVGVYVNPNLEVMQKEALPLYMMSKDFAQAKLAKIGQWGGVGGGARDIDIAPRRLKSLTIGSGKVIYSLEFSYDDHHEKNHTTGPWGGHGPEGHGNKIRDKIVLQPTESLTVVSGTIGPYDSAPAGVIKSLTFITTAGRYGPFGEEKGTPFQIPVQSNGSIIGFFAHAGWYLDAFGIYVKPMQETEEAGLAKIGPWGGNGGQVRDLKMPPQRIESVTICSGTVLNSLTFMYHGHDGKKHTAGPWGASTGNPDQTDTILLCSSEFLTGVRGTTGPFDPASSDVIVTSLTLIMNTHSYGPFGQGRGTSFQIPLWGKGSIVGFFGCSESYINAIGVYVNPYLEAMQKELVSSREPRLTKIGPWGGNGDKGNVRDINAKMEPQHLESVTVSFGSVINSLSFSYIDFKGVKHNVGPWGTPSGNSYKIVLESSEVLQGVSGTVGSSDGTSSNLVTSLTFATDQARAYGPFGAGGGTPFSAAAAAGTDGPVVAFFGRAGLCLEALGVYVHRY